MPLQATAKTLGMHLANDTAEVRAFICTGLTVTPPFRPFPPFRCGPAGAGPSIPL